MQTQTTLKPIAHRLNTVQALRGLAACLVMVSHLWVIESKYSPDQILGTWADFGQLGVDLFFAISGFIMVYVTWDTPRSPKTAGRFMLARACRIYPIYWLVSAALICVWLIRPEMVFSSAGPDPNIVKSVLLLPDKQLPLLAVGWTLIHEMFFYLVFALSLLLSRKALLPILGLWGAVTVIGYHLGGANISPEFALIFNPLSFEFILGAFAAWVFKTTNGKWLIQSACLCMSMWLFLVIFITVNSHTMPLDAFDRTLNFAGPCALLLYVMTALHHKGFQPPRWCVAIGDWSYGLYLTHILTLSLLGRIWQKFARNGPLDNIIALSLMSIASIAVSGLLWKIVEAPLIRFFKLRLNPNPTPQL